MIKILRYFKNEIRYLISCLMMSKNQMNYLEWNWMMNNEDMKNMKNENKNSQNKRMTKRSNITIKSY